jgi:hypothetical protein
MTERKCYTFSMHFWKSALVLFSVLFVSICALLASSQPSQAATSINSTFIVPVPTTTVGTIRHIRIDQSNGKIYLPTSSFTSLGHMSTDGTTFSVISYSPALATNTSSDFAVSNNQAYVSINGSGNSTLYRYDISGSIATFVASSTLTPGTTSLTLNDDGNVYVSKNSKVNVFDASLGFISSTTALNTPTRMAYGGGKLFYVSSAGRFARLILDGSGVAVSEVTDITIATGGPTSATIKGLAASSDGTALYYASNSTLGKISVASGATLWTRSISNIAGIDIDKTTGRIIVATTNGVISSYDPINPVTSVSASASSTNVVLNWTSGALDGDFTGVTIRRSTSGYPTSVLDGTAVTSTDVDTSLTDSSLDEGVYYYSFFNETSDGYYSQGATSTVTIDLPPEAPVLTAETTGNTAHLSWSVPASTESFVIRRSTDGFPTTYTDGTGVTTTNSSIINLTQTDLADGTYYYSIFAADSGGQHSAAGTASITIDTTGPTPPLLSATASSSNVSLSWDIPPTAISFLLRRDSSTFPTSITDGIAVTTTSLTSIVQIGLIDGHYYYSVFARDSYGNYSNAGTANIEIDTTGPSAPTSFAAIVSASDVHLTWSNPVDSDFASSLIRRSATTFPTSISEGINVTSTTATSYYDSSLADGTYYYSIFALDTLGNISIYATSSVRIDTYVPPIPASSGGGGGGAAAGSSVFTLPSAINVMSLFPPATNDIKTNTTVLPPSSKTLSPPNLNNTLEKNLSQTRPITIAKPTTTFTRNLRQGDRGADVKALQVFLNTHGYIIAKTGQGSPGKETTFFGEATAKAVKKFQETNRETILKPYNLEKGTGIFGTKMREILSNVE